MLKLPVQITKMISRQLVRIFRGLGCGRRRRAWPGDRPQSTLAKPQIILYQTSDAPSYDIYVERSFADYLWKCLEDAAAEYGLAIARG